MTTDDAFNEWRAHLSTLGLRALLIEERNGSNFIGFPSTPEEAINALSGGEPVRWSALVEEAGITDPDMVWPLLERADEAFREKGQRGLVLVLGSLTVPDLGELPLATAPLIATRVGRRVNDVTLELAGPPSLCDVTVETLRRDYGLDLTLPENSLTAAHQAIIQTALSSFPPPLVVRGRTGLALQLSGWLDVLQDINSFPGESSVLVSALAGNLEARLLLRASGGPVPTDGSPITVLPADESQLDAVSRALAGQSLIVEGPPGTGKSQTIANLLAAAVGSGQRAIFVAEKRAAVEVVLRRLDEAGLSALVLDIHDSSARFAGLAEIQDTDPSGVFDASGAAAATLPDLPLSSAHFTDVEVSADNLAAVLRRPQGSLPEIDAGLASSLLAREQEVISAARAFRLASAAICKSGVMVDPARVLQFSQHQESIKALAEALHAVPAAFRQVGTVVAAATATQRLMQLRGHLDERQSLPVDNTCTQSTVERYYRGPFTDANSQSAIVSTLVQLTNDLRSLDVALGQVSVGALLDECNATDWACLAAASELIRLLSGLTVSGTPLTDLTPLEVASLLQQWIRPLRQLAETDPAALTLLSETGLLQTLIAETNPDELLSAVLGAARAAGLRLVGGQALRDEAESADARIQALRLAERKRVADVAKGLRRALEADRTLVGDVITLEGFARKARTRRITNATVLSAAASAVLARTPIVVASPWTVARCLPQTLDLFALAVFDEASQIETPAALPTLSRASRAVVFGDSLQLPPTRFFQAARQEADDIVLAQGSLLDAFATILSGTDRTSYLRWHYRSLDPRLVEFVASSPTLYAGRLILTAAPPQLPTPIELVRTDGRDIVSVVRERLSAVTPGATVAVLTLGMELADRLQRGLQLPTAGTDEATIVRNVERFQGDERDEIILVLPVVEDGASALTALGPVNLAGGERRLNVALTRARSHMTIVSGFGSIDLLEGSSKGAVLLRQFLENLEEGGAEAPVGAVAEPLVAALASRLLLEAFEVQIADHRSACAVPLIVRVPGGRAVGVDVEFAAKARLSPLDRQLLRVGELDRRGWLRVDSTVKDWIEDGQSVIDHIRALSEEGTPR